VPRPFDENYGVLDWGSDIAANVGSSIYDAFTNPFQREQERLDREGRAWYENIAIPTPFGAISPFSSMNRIGTGMVTDLFQAAQEPVNIAASYYSGLPTVEPVSKLGGESLRDITAAGFELPIPIGGPLGSLPEVKVTNPYALETIEKVGGEALEELSDPTNIPGAFIGAGGMLGRAATGAERALAGMGAVSGIGGGVPELVGGLESVTTEGLTPESYGRIIEGLMGIGFGGLSASGLAAPSIQPKIDSSGTPLATTLNERLGLPEGFVIPGNVDINLEGITEALPFQYDPTQVGMGLGGLTVKGPEVEIAAEPIVEPAPIVEAAIAPAQVEEPIEVEPIIEKEPPIQISPKEELGLIVSDLKQKYGEKNWRKEMTEVEKSTFGEAQLAAVQAPVQKEIEIAPKAEIAAPVQGPTAIQPPITALPPVQPPGIPPPKEPVISEEPPRPAGKLSPLSLFDRIVRPTLVNLAKTNPTIGRLVKSYDAYHTKIASENIADVKEVTSGVNKAGEQKIIRFLDGETGIKLDQHETKVATSLRTTLDKIANLAEQNQVLVGYRQGYFPRKYEDKFEWDISPRSFGTKNMPLGHLEKSRKGNRQNFRRDFKVLEEYINEATRRISEAKFLGKDLGFVTGKQYTGERPTVEYVEKAISKVTGRERSSTPARFADRLRKITALGDLAFAALYQPAQAAHTASTVGLRRATRAAFQTITNFSKEQLEATRSGALWPNISHEVSKAVGDKGYMHGIPTMDKVMRVHANVAGRLLAQDAKRGNSYARRQIDSLGLKLDDVNLESKAGQAISDKTQFRTGTLDLPLWTHSPLGKLAFQYSSFAYAHGRFVADMFKHPVKNFGQIMRFAAIGALAGEGVADLREILKSLIPGKDEDDEILRRMLEAAAGDESFDDKSWLKKLQAATRNKRIPITSPGWRVIQNLSMVGGVGIFQNILEKAASGRFAELPIGPAGGLVVDTAKALHGDVEKGVEKGDWRFRNSLRNFLLNVPGPPLIEKRKIADDLIPTERRSGGFKISPPKLNLPRVRPIT